MSTDFFDSEVDEFEAYLAHEGVVRRSGRYPWGSGENPYQRNKTFLARVGELEKKGLTESEIAKAFGLKSSTDLRALRQIATNQKRAADISQARRLKETGMSNVAIGREMGMNESTVRGLLAPGAEDRANRITTTASFLKEKAQETGYLDVGRGVENHMGISDTQKKTAIKMLEEEGYKVYYYKTEQLGTGKETNVMVLATPEKGAEGFGALTKNPNQIQVISGYSEDNGRTFEKPRPPQSVDSKRIGVRYGDEGGADMDGVIQLRRGVEDLSLGGKSYAQVRIAVDGSHYLKGMAMYSDKMPDGVDMVFNTNKKNTGNKLDAMKPMKKDLDNPDYIDDSMPFGSMVRQKTYIGKDGKEHLSPLNRVGTKKLDEDGNDISYSGEEGGWNTWSKTLSSQMLSKQNPDLAKQQLDLTYRIRKEEYDEIMSLTNPVVKKKLLDEFADGADASSVHLKAAGLPRTTNKVILPINSLKDNEVYAPTYNNGEKVVLIRHPHGGRFEIPELTVNNRNREALSVLKQAEDAIGINAKVASRLSGADFDGDTVLVIPNRDRKVKTQAPLEGLKNFDPQSAYPAYEGMPKMSPRTKQTQMGVVSNLITDMTIQGATNAELARAVRHSMVVIDAEKHNLNYKQSAIDNGIADLKSKYQERTTGGASTLISKARSTQIVEARKPRSVKDGGPVDPVTGKKMWEYTGEGYTKSVVDKRTGKVTEKFVPKTTKSSKMAETDDARTLVSKSGTVMENVYADHANRLKAIANDARKASIAIKPPRLDIEAKQRYKDEVDSLRAKLNIAKSNAPLERKAQLVAKSIVTAKRQANPGMDSAELKKIKAQAQEEARTRLGAKKTPVKFTDKEWEAIQSGAVSSNLLTSLLQNADMDQVKQLATPRERPVMTPAKTKLAQSMLNRGYTQAEISEKLGIPASTISSVLA